MIIFFSKVTKIDFPTCKPGYLPPKTTIQITVPIPEKINDRYEIRLWQHKATLGFTNRCPCYCD